MLLVEAGEEFGHDGGTFLAFDFDGGDDLDLGAALDFGDLGDGGLHADPGTDLTVVSMLFLLGTVIFMLALWRTSSVPKGAIILYTASSLPIALRTVFPETVLQLGLVGLAVAAAFLATWMLRNIPRTTAADGAAARVQSAAVTAP